MTTFCFLVKGKVQGVGFRQNVVDIANEWGFNGYVMNLPDGDVKIVIQLSSEQFPFFYERLKEGTHLSRIDEISIHTYDDICESGFFIRR